MSASHGCIVLKGSIGVSHLCDTMAHICHLGDTCIGLFSKKGGIVTTFAGFGGLSRPGCHMGDNSGFVLYHAGIFYSRRRSA